MKKILKEIQTGQFTREWVREYKGGLKKYHRLLKQGESHKIEKTGAYLRGMMPWMSKKNIKGVQAFLRVVVAKRFGACSITIRSPIWTSV